MGWIAGLALVAVVVLMVYIRLAPSDPGRWHLDPADLVPEGAGWRAGVLFPPGATDGVVLMPGGAYASVFFPEETPADVLDRLAKIAEATPRTRRLAGSSNDGLVTWQTRSRFWGFPDFTTAKAEPRVSSGQTYGVDTGTMLFIVARQRFGREDLGVNAARLRDWLSRL
jgi:uncharacterized protein (DUF1499 family)